MTTGDGMGDNNDMETTTMTAFEIAETLVNGNISDAREAIIKGRTCKGAAAAALDVASAMADMIPNMYSDGERYAAAIVRVRRCIDPYGETTT